MFFDNVDNALKRAGLPTMKTRYIAFKRYPLRTYHAELMAAARAIYPNEPVSYGFYEVAHGVYPTFAASMVGRAIFAVAGRDFKKIVKLAPRGYAASNTHGTFSVVELEGDRCVCALDDIWDPPSFTAGIFQGALEVCGLRAEVFEVDVERPGTLTVSLQWAPAA